MSRHLLSFILLAAIFASSSERTAPNAGKGKLSPLQDYVARVSGTVSQQASAPGSLWPVSGGLLTDLAIDYKARQINDLVTIRIVEQTLAQASGTVDAQRTFAADSKIASVGGQNISYLNPLYSLGSSRNLKGSGTANSQSLLRTSVAGRVVAVLPNGNFVVEAERSVSFNQQNQIILLRGLVRPGDIASDDSVLSSSISNLEVEIVGKGVVSDAVRQPSLFIRLLTRFLGF